MPVSSPYRRDIFILSRRLVILPMNSRPKVICLGEALLDRLVVCGRVPLKTKVEHFEDKLGGAPANVACGLARLGTPSAFIGRLGPDETGEAFMQLFAKRGIELTGLQRDSNLPSRIVLVHRQSDGERIFQGFAGDEGQGFSDQALDCSELQVSWTTLAAEAKWLLIGTIPLASPASARSLLWAVNQSKTAGMKIALDVNWRPTFWESNNDPCAGPSTGALDAMKPLIEATSLLKLAKEEAVWLFGTDDPSSISKTLAQVPDVVVTNGAKPIHWHFAGRSGVLEVLAPTQVVDTTGAGDAFTAGILHQLVQHGDEPVPYEQVLRFAAACGALVCGGAGAIDPQPDSGAVQNFLKNY